MKMVYSNRGLIIYYWHLGRHPYTVAKLPSEALQTSRSWVTKFLMKYKQTVTIGRWPGSGRSSKILLQILDIVEAQMQIDDETTAVQLQKILADQRHKLSWKSILRLRSKLGWPFHGRPTANSSENRTRQRGWSGQSRMKMLLLTVSLLMLHGLMSVAFSWRVIKDLAVGIGKASKTQAKTKTSCKGSCVGRDKLDNDPKHVSTRAWKWMEKGINWWKTSAESPYINSIDNLWHNLNVYLRRQSGTSNIWNLN